MEGYQEIEFGKEKEKILIKLLDEPFEKNSVGMVESDLFEGRVVVLFVDFRTEDEIRSMIAGNSGLSDISFSMC